MGVLQLPPKPLRRRDTSINRPRPIFNFVESSLYLHLYLHLYLYLYLYIPMFWNLYGSSPKEPPQRSHGPSERPNSHRPANVPSWALMVPLAWALDPHKNSATHEAFNKNPLVGTQTTCMHSRASYGPLASYEPLASYGPLLILVGLFYGPIWSVVHSWHVLRSRLSVHTRGPWFGL